MAGHLQTSHAQVVVAPNVPIQNQPGVGTTAGSNNVPVVNIVAPNGAGVSHNIYNQFNVGSQGLILNNSNVNTNTQLGGYIQGNANLVYGNARVILNEVNSGNASHLGGYIEVGGQRADVIIANPAGISVDGAGFINAAGVTLTTGIPQFNTWGAIESYRVGGGRISVAGLGLNASHTDYTTIITRAVEINAGLWANHLTVAAGTGTFAPDGTPMETTDTANKPQFAIDVALLGGMYSNKIYLIGTEHGVGVNNAGQIMAGAGEVHLTAEGRLINKGRINSTGDGANIQINAADDISNTGTLYTTGSASVQSGAALTNAGTLAAQGNLSVNAQAVDNQSDALIAAGLNSDNSLNTTGNLDLNATYHLTNDGILIAGGNASIIADILGNSKDGEIVGQKSLAIEATTFTNRGLVDGAAVHIEANALDNVGTGRIYGNTLAIDARILHNHAETVGSQTSAAVIAARAGLHIGADTLTNEGNALIYSAGDITIGGSLDASHEATGSATLITNDGAIIEAAGTAQNSSGNIIITAVDVKNLNSELATQQIVVDTQNKFTHDIPLGSLSWDNADVIYIGEGSNGSYSYYSIGKGASISDTISLIGTSSDYFLLIPSSVYTKDQTDYVLSVGGLYEAGLVGGVPNLDAYAPDDSIWNVFNLTPPSAAPIAPAVDCAVISCSTQQQTLYDTYQSDLVQWQTDNTGAYWNLGLVIMDYNSDFDNRKVSAETLHQYTETQYSTEVTASNPGQILAAGNITINGILTNDNSRVMAGETIYADTLINTATKGEDSVVRAGTQVMTIRDASGRTWSIPVTYAPTTVNSTQTDLGIAQYEQNASYSGSNGGGSAGSINLPGMSNNALYQINPGTNSNYLIETDPRFTNYGTWLSSDYMLQALGFDPAVAQKRFGDGFYEQQLIREQVGQLTGYHFLAGYQNNEEMYQALMVAGVEFAQDFNITPGITLTAEQMSVLTTDMVWLVSKEVTLPDGSVETVLVPQVYLKSGNSMLTTDGALVSAGNVVIGDTELANHTANPTYFYNSATIAAQNTLIVSAQNITNELGHLHGNDTYLQATQDITNTGGVISADNSITIVAGGDFTQQSTTFESQTEHHTVKDISNVAAVYLSGNRQQQGQQEDQQEVDIETESQTGSQANNTSSTNAGQIYIQAGGDITNTGGMIINAAQGTQEETAQTVLVAGNNIELQSLESYRSESFNYDAMNWYSKESTTQNASQIQAMGDITLVANNQINITGSQVESMDGDLTLSAKEVNIGAAATRDTAMGSSYTEHKGTMSKKTSHAMSYEDSQGLSSSNLGAKNITVVTTGDQNYTASSVIADENLTLVSQEGNINVAAGETNSTSLTYNKTQKSGVTGSGGAGISIGKEQTTRTELSIAQGAQGTTLGSLGGDITISAQQGTYNQVGSDVLALQGDINVIAQDIHIEEARETSTYIETYEYKKSGVTVGVSSPLVSMAQQAKQMSDASDKTSSSRMDALAAGAVALNVYTNYDGAVDSVKNLASGNLSSVGSLSVSFGTQKAKSQSMETSDTGKGSNVSAGGNINMVATGNKNDIEGNKDSGNILIQGSAVTAQNDITLIANNQLNVKAAQNTQMGLSSNKSSSASVGVSVGAGGPSVSVGASQGKGSSNSLDQTWSYGSVEAGNTLTVVTGGDANLIGGQLAGNTVIADIGGDLNIQTLQDVSISQSKQKDTSASLSVSLSGVVGGSVGHSKANASGTYISANEYAGIMAGDGGFDINVEGNTALIGGIIASTENAAQNNKNSLTTGTLTTQDLINVSSYDAKGSTLTMGVSGGGGNALSPAGSMAGVSKDSGFDSSITVAGISNGVITITDEEGQKQKTVQTAEETINNINTNIQTGMATGGLAKDWDTQELLDKVQAEAQIFANFSSQAAKGVGTFAQNRQAAIQKQVADLMLGEDTPENQQLLAELREEYNRWGEGGVYKVVAHAIAGGLAGDLSGALGAGGSALVAGQMNEITKDLPDGVKQAIGAGIAAGIGGVLGGNTGASAAFNQDINNRQLHNDEKAVLAKLAKEKACENNPTCTQDQINYWYKTYETAALYLVDTQSEAATEYYIDQMLQFQAQLGGAYSHQNASDRITDMVTDLAGAYRALKEISGQEITGEKDYYGNPLYYFSATDEQRNNEMILAAYPQNDDDYWSVSNTAGNYLGSALENLWSNYYGSPFGTIEQVMPETYIIGAGGVLKLVGAGTVAKNAASSAAQSISSIPALQGTISIPALESAVVGAGISGGANAGIQYWLTGDINWADVAIATTVGGVTGGAGGGFWVTVGTNTAGGGLSAGLKGESILWGMAGSGLSAGVGWGVGQSITKLANAQINPINYKYQQEIVLQQWKNGTVIELTKFRTPSNLPSYFGNVAESGAAEYTQNQLQSILKRENDGSN
ncbi:hemagglutinin repeat-containing protein [Saezia sanguinis]|uniref:two-partner secretion domain-containing protein n=1 Tax=Saezia sanguinis TaxID=1965230 RepID=UPI0030D8566A